MTSVLMGVVLQASFLGATPGDYGIAGRERVETDRPLVILLGATWCPGCVEMKESVLPAIAKKGGLREVAYKYVDVDKNRELARKLLRGKAIPQLVRLEKTSAGWQVDRLTGAHPVKEVRSFIRRGEIR